MKNLFGIYCIIIFKMNNRTTVYYSVSRTDASDYVFPIDEEKSWIKYYQREWHVTPRFVAKENTSDYDDKNKFRHRNRINRMGNAYFFWWN